jgi:hypothetical protein
MSRQIAELELHKRIEPGPAARGVTEKEIKTPKARVHAQAWKTWTARIAFLLKLRNSN